MADLARGLNIEIGRSDSGPAVRILSARLTSACRAFIGKTVEETLARLPALFSVCATAQRAACTAACAAASGEAPACARGRLSNLAVNAETVKEHLWRILLDWPRFLDMDSNAAAMAAAMRAYAALRGGLDAGQAVAPSTVRQALDALARVCADQVLGAAPADWLAALESPTALAAWADRSTTGAARLVRALLESGWASLGASQVALLPALSVDELEALIGGEDAAAFVAAPHWRGQPAETSPYTRNRAHPLVESLTAELGSGLLPRIGAQLLELAALLDRLQQSLVGDAAPEPGIAGSPTPGVGLAGCQAARGLLVHRIVLDGGRVADYRILAPTEWNFHPDGVVARGLADLSAPDEATLRRQAHLFITAVDPCVDYALSVS
jgi:hypothetical protein